MPDAQDNTTILHRGISKNQKVNITDPSIAGNGVKWPGKIIGANFGENTVMVEIEVPACWVKERG